MTTGRVAAETIVSLKRRREEMSKANLADYRRRLEDTFVMKDMKKYRRIPDFLHGNKQVFNVYPKLFAGAAQNWFRVDGKDKRTKEKEIMASFRKGRSMMGLVGDAFKLARAWR